MMKAKFAASVLCLAAFSAVAQKAAPSGKDTVVLEGFISADQTLAPNKAYVVKYNVKVGKGAVLTISPGTQIFFEPGTSLVLEGGLQAEGAPNNFIEFTSRNPGLPGSGLVVRGNQGKDINIRYAVFRELNLPLKFESEWYRKNVIVEKNVFKELYTGESSVLITSPLVDYQPGADNSVNFSFSNNAFYDNWSSIFIENFEDNFMKLRFDNNLLTNNVVYGIDIGIPSNTPVFGLFDDQKREQKMQMEGNSIFGNYQINSSTDTIIREISVGIQGEGEQFSIPGNFFRSKNPDYVSSTFDHFFQNSSLPLLKAQPILPEPKEIAPPHIWKVKIAGSEVMNYDDLPRDVDPRNVAFEVHFNKPVSQLDKSQLEVITLDTLVEKITKTPVAISNSKWSGDKKVFSFNVSNASFLRDPYAYIRLMNFKDAEGFLVPNFSIGQRSAVNKYKRSYSGGIQSAEFIAAKSGSINVGMDGKAFLPDQKSVKTLETLTDLGVLKNLGPYRSLTKTWEIGLMLGASNYFGTLTYNLADRDEYNFSIGLYGQYNMNKWLSFRATFQYLKISGNEIGDGDPDRARRALNFKNNMVEGSLTAHWHVLKYGTSRGEKFTPTIFAGIGVFRNAPMSQIYLYSNDKNEPVYLTYKSDKFFYDGTGDPIWIPLRPVGLEGQTVGGVDPEAFSQSKNADLFAGREAPKQFKKVQVSFPIGFSLDYIIYNKWVISAELGVHITTTKYLDGAGGYYWDRGSSYDANGGFEFDPIYGLPVDAHGTIVNANPEIWGKVGRDKILIHDGNVPCPDPGQPCNRIGFSDPTALDPVTGQPLYTEYDVAALLANPSLVNLDQARANPDPNQPNPNSSYNDAFTFNNAKKGNPSALDHFGFVGLKISKVIGKKEKKPKSKATVKFKDNDKDALSDEEEKLKGTNPRNPDTDDDGLIDGEEVKLGTDPLKVDTDEDGLNDYKEASELSTDPTNKDTDSDGLGDGDEVNTHHTDPNNPDSDAGGVNDGDEVNAHKTNPMKRDDDPMDSDGDGIINSKDECPNQRGEARFEGCPDSDGDGLMDKEDECPQVAGVRERKGCPQEEPEEQQKKEVEEDLQKLLNNIEFDTNKDVIKSTSFGDLNTATEILSEHDSYNVIIEGHTDDVGDDAANKMLSQKRAEAVKSYLARRGVSESRIVAVGYGEERPIASNDTEEGRQRNRRVTIKLVKPY